MATNGLTPHGPGFRFVDRFERTGETSGSGWRNFDESEPFFADHFPSQPIVPAVLLVECAAQTAGILLMQGAEKAMTPLFLASVDQFRIMTSVLPGETVHTRVSIIKELAHLVQVEVECSVLERTVAKGRLILSRELAPAAI